MKRIAIILLLAVSACHRKVEVSSAPAPAAPAPGTPGAASPREAVVKFMSAVKVQDLDALSLIWGSTAGPVRQTMNREEWEMREVTIMRCLRHESYRVAAEGPVAGGERAVTVDVTFQDLTPTTNFTVTRDSAGRWYVRMVDMKPLEQLCSRRL